MPTESNEQAHMQTLHRTLSAILKNPILLLFGRASISILKNEVGGEITIKFKWIAKKSL